MSGLTGFLEEGSYSNPFVERFSVQKTILFCLRRAGHSSA
jgi:hypothetical protein